MRASLRLSVCAKCRDIYKSCDLFQPYELSLSNQNKVSLSSYLENMTNENGNYENNENGKDFLISETYCAVAADINSSDSFWFLKINDISCDFQTDEYNHTVHAGQKYYKGFFLEEEYPISKWKFFRIIRKNALVLRKSIIYPLVQFVEKKNKLFISNQE